MNEIHAKPIVDGKFWIVESDQKKIGILKVTDQKKYVLSSKDKITTFDSKKKLVEQFGTDFFIKQTTSTEQLKDRSVNGFPTNTIPHNPIYDVKRHLPLYTKSNKSKSIYCAGYYIINFNKGWVKSFCPKLITVERYPYQGPFRSDLEMKQRLNNVSK